MIKETEKHWNKDIGCVACIHTAKEHNKAKDNERGMLCPRCNTLYSLLPKQPLLTIDTFPKYGIGDKVELLMPESLPCKVIDVLYSFMHECYHYSVELDKPLIMDNGRRVFTYSKVDEASLM